MCKECDEEYTGVLQEHSNSSVMRLKERVMQAIERAVSGTRIGVRSEEPQTERDLR